MLASSLQCGNTTLTRCDTSWSRDSDVIKLKSDIFLLCRPKSDSCDTKTAICYRFTSACSGNKTPISVCLLSSRSQKPWGTKPVYPSQEVSVRMAGSWRPTAPRPFTPGPPSARAPASPWSPPNSRENQKPLKCLIPKPKNQSVNKTNRREVGSRRVPWRVRDQTDRTTDSTEPDRFSQSNLTFSNCAACIRGSWESTGARTLPVTG